MTGRVSVRRWISVCERSLPIFLTLLYSCREDIPSAPSPGTVDLQFALPLNSYYSYDNWILYPNGTPITESQYRTSWTVIDTGAVALGFSGVTNVVESTFVSSAVRVNAPMEVRHRYFHTASNGDVFEYGFVSHLLLLRDSLQVAPQWDKLLSPSAGLDVPWQVEEGDSESIGVVEGRFFPQLETVRDSINGVAMGVLAYHAEITATDLTVGLWVGGSPPVVLRIVDQSDVAFNRVFQELRVRRTR